MLNNNMTMMMVEGFQDCSICRRDWIEPGQKNSQCPWTLNGDDDDGDDVDHVNDDNDGDGMVSR